MTSVKPLVSIITATYNTAKYLPETIESVLNQTYHNIEYIVLDDGSTDDTQQILQQYAGRIRIEYHENMGETSTVNRGFSLAQGEYVIVVSADDPVKPRLVEVGVDFLKHHSEVLVAYPSWDVIDSESKVILQHPMFEYDYDVLLRWHYCIAGPGSIIRRTGIELEKGRDPEYRYIADYEFWLRLGLLGPFAHIPENLAMWRYHPSSTTVTSRGEAMAEEHVRAIRNLYKRHDLEPRIRRARAEAMSTAYFVAATNLLPDSPEKARHYLIRSLLHYPFAPRSYPSGLVRPYHHMMHIICPLIQTVEERWKIYHHKIATAYQRVRKR